MGGMSLQYLLNIYEEVDTKMAILFLLSDCVNPFVYFVWVGSYTDILSGGVSYMYRKRPAEKRLKALGNMRADQSRETKTVHL